MHRYHVKSSQTEIKAGNVNYTSSVLFLSLSKKKPSLLLAFVMHLSTKATVVDRFRSSGLEVSLLSNSRE